MRRSTVAGGLGRGAARIIGFAVLAGLLVLIGMRAVTQTRALVEMMKPPRPSTQRAVAVPPGLPVVPVDLAATTLTADDLGSTGLAASTFHAARPVKASDEFSDRTAVTRAAQDKFVGGLTTTYVGGDRDAPFAVDIRLTDFVNDAWARPIPRAGETDAAGDYPSGSLVSGSVTEAREMAMVRSAKGRIAVVVVIHVTRPARDRYAIDPAESARRIALLQHGRVPAVGNLNDETTVDLSRERLISGVTLSGTVLLIALGSQVASALSDAGTREVLRPRRRRDRGGPNTVDLTRAVARRRRRLTAASLLKSVAVMVAVGAVYFGTGDLRTLPTLLLTAAVLFALTTVIELVSRWLRPTGFRQTGGLRVVLAVLLGNALSLVALAVGALFITLGVTGLLMTSGREFILAAVALFVAGLVVLNLGSRPLRHLRRRTAPLVEETVRRDDRAPILLLRSFQDDDLTIRMHRTGRQSFVESLSTEGFARFEEMLAWVFWRSGPVLAIGQPGTKLQPLGAARAYYTDDDWQDAVLARMRQAQAVVFVVGRSPGLVWEITQVRQQGALARALFVFPPEADDEIADRVRVLSAALSIDPRLVLDGLGDGNRLLAVYLDEKGVPFRVVADGRDDLAYEKTFEEALARTTAEPLWDPAPEYRAPRTDVSDLLVSFDPQSRRPPRASILRRTLARLLDLQV